MSFNHPFGDLMPLFLQSSQHGFLTSTIALIVIGFINGTIYISLTPQLDSKLQDTGVCAFLTFMFPMVFF